MKHAPQPVPADQPKKIVSFGEILVDIIAAEPGQGFHQPMALRGPFAGGAPATFAAQVARLGHPVGLISCVGDDDFGWLNIDRLKALGVDVSAVKVHADRATASAFVRYQDDGERDFLFNLKRSAAGEITLDAPARRLLGECAHFHVMGSSLFSFHLIDEVKKAIEIVKSHGGTVSFDPNVRKEMLDIPEMRAGLELLLQDTDIFLPSGPELLLPTDAKNESEAIEALLALGVQRIIVKRRGRGASYIDRERAFDMPSYQVEEVEPTGAGDCFGGTFVTCLHLGMTLEDCLRYANAAGALAVSRAGGIAGTSDFAEMRALMGVKA
ncbi:MAG: sugar kinase [Rhodospirillales bacterium 20-64-7]|nr:MAG: sugar kinase [Rhodospirillales bacterium 20-64-7]